MAFLATRRRFLVGMLGAGMSLGAVAVHRTFRHANARGAGEPVLPDGLQMATRTGWAFGSRVSMTVAHRDGVVAQRSLDAAFEQLDLVDQLMSLYRSDSQVSRLNRQGTLHDPHPLLCEVLKAAETMSRKTDGAFDITVQPLWPVYEAACREGRNPEAMFLARAVGKIDWRQVEVSSNRVRLLKEGSAITLNGIAQGFAADRVLESLRACGVEHALVDSGEIGTLGGKTAQEDWSVAVQHPRQENALLCLAKLRGRCLSTSGDYATSFREDHRDHHIFDPRTGRSAGTFASVSVAAPTATEADALSTAVFVLGPEPGLQLVQATPAADALLVLKDGRTFSTKGFPIAG